MTDLTEEQQLVRGLKEGYKHSELGFMGNTRRNTEACCYEICENKIFSLHYTSFQQAEIAEKFPSINSTKIQDCEVMIIERRSDYKRFYICFSITFDERDLGERIFQENSDQSVVELGDMEWDYQSHQISDNETLSKELENLDGSSDVSDEVILSTIALLEKL